jgi:hypothetical protein
LCHFYYPSRIGVGQHSGLNRDASWDSPLKNATETFMAEFEVEGGEKIMACGMKHPKAKKTTKKSTSKKK